MVVHTHTHKERQVKMKTVECGEIPVVDFEDYKLYRKDKPTDEELGQIVTDIKDALASCNAFFINNHGLKESQISQIINKGREFFALPLEEKNKYYLDTGVPYPVGYIHELHKPREDVPDGQGRQAFLFSPWIDIDQKRYPGNEIAPGWIEDMMDYFKEATQLFLRLMECISLVLGLGREYMSENYLQNMKASVPVETQASLRLNEFPPILNGPAGESNLRLGIHADYTMLTLLYITEKGLMSQLPDGKWFAVDPKPGCILVQAGFILHNLTKGRIPQNKHCVVAPPGGEGMDRYRHSLVFFGSPDYHTYLSPIPELEEADGWEEMEQVHDSRPIGEIRKQLMNTLALRSGAIDPKLILE